MPTTKDQQQQTFPAAPPSPSAGDHEMRGDHAAQAASRPIATDAYPYSRGLTPYLGLHARLSQVWINKWTVLLILALIRTLIAIVSLNKDLASARTQALSGCSDVEGVGSTLASMPYYMAQGVNELTADGINKAVNGLMTMLMMTLTGVEDIILFVIHMMTNTYLCLITLAVSGGLHVAISVAEDVSNFLNSTLHNIGNDIQTTANDFESSLNSVISGIDKTFGAKIPTLNLNSSIQALENLQMPSSVDQGLNTLNNSIPTFADVQNFTNTVISFPFEEVKKLINESMPKYNFDRSLFPVPQKQSLTFCSDNNGIAGFFDELAELVILAHKLFIIIILILAALACIPMAYREIRRWRWMKDRAKLISVDTQDPLDSVYIVSRPYTASLGLWASKRVRSTRIKILIRWTIAYATTVPALFVLALGVAGLLGCLCQFILLKIIEREVPILENEVENFADKVVSSLVNASNSWATGTNSIINDTNTMINKDVLGWVNTTTTAVNNTLNVFVNDTIGVLNKTFGGTVLYDPIMEVINCLVLLKVKGIEDGLTWVQDHAYVDFPLLPNDTFTRGAVASIANETGNGGSLNSLLASPNTAAGNKIQEAVNFMTNALSDALRQETIISFCVVLVWVIILLVGFFRALMLLFWPGKLVHDDRAFSDPNDVLAAKSSGVSITGSDRDRLYASDKYEPIITVISPSAPSDSAHLPSPPYDAHEQSNHSANLYNGQPYTLAPRSFPASRPSEPMTNANSLNAKTGPLPPARIRAMNYQRMSQLDDPFTDNAR